jgi:beta-galactosidase
VRATTLAVVTAWPFSGIALSPDTWVRLDDGSRARVWTEELHVGSAQVLARYAEGPLPGVPALTRRVVSRGAAWYLATRLAEEDLRRWLRVLLDGAGVRPVVDLPDDVRGLVDVTRRRAGERSWLFVLNHAAVPARVAARGRDLVSGRDVAEELVVDAGGYAVVRESS